MTKTQKKREWFAVVPHGFGAYPTSWQGYSITILFFTVLLWRGLVARYDPYLFIWEAAFFIVVYVYIARKTSDKKWRWRI